MSKQFFFLKRKPVTFLFFFIKETKDPKEIMKNYPLKFLEISICHLLTGSVVSSSRKTGRFSLDICMDLTPRSLHLIQVVLSVGDEITRKPPKSTLRQGACSMQLH